MASLPISGTNIRLLSGVPFSNDYKHTRWFDSESQQQSYFLSKNVVHLEANANFQRVTNKTYIKVNKSIDQLWGTNYVMFQNASYNTKWFYAFVTKLVYINSAMTEVHFELDVFQTWKFQLTFKPSFVSREHCPLWEGNGQPVINTVEEGLNYGSEYDIKAVDNYNVTGDIMYLVIVSKSTLHTDDENSSGLIVANINGVPQPLSTYVHPFDSYGGSPNVNYDGGSTALSTVIEILNSLYLVPEAVNNIVSLYITNHVGLDAYYSGGDLNINFSLYQDIKFVTVGNAFNTIYIGKQMNYPSTDVYCKPKYSSLTSGVTESKLLMSPYTIIELTDFKGNISVLKPEYINSSDIVVSVFGSMGYSNKVAYIPKNYLTNNNESDSINTMASIGNGLIDNNPNDVAVITDMLAAFFQGNRNSLENQKDSIVFNGNMDVAAGATNAISSALRGNIGGAVGGLEQGVRGGGNALLKIEGLHAKLKDIDNVPPQIQKMGSNSAFDFGNGYKGFWLVSKQVKPEYRKKLQEFWNMYGYKLNEVKIPNFHTRSSWNFVQTVSCVVVGSINNDDLEEFKAIFDNGITLWHTDDVGNYFLDNGVI